MLIHTVRYRPSFSLFGLQLPYNVVHYLFSLLLLFVLAEIPDLHVLHGVNLTLSSRETDCKCG